MLSLKDREWGTFLLSDLFTLQSGKCNQANKLEHTSKKCGIPYIGATNRNGGVLYFVKPIAKLISLGNAIAFVCDGEGSMGYSFYKKESCIATTNIIFGYSEKLNRYNGVFITTIADTIRGKYSYNYKRRELRLRKERLQLPITGDGKPDYDFMEQYIREREQQILRNYITCIGKVEESEKKITPLNKKEWKEFRIEEVVTINSGCDIYDDERVPGNIPYISSSSVNNGICHFVSNTNETLEPNCISVNRNGSVGYAFFHPYNALYSNDCRKLRPTVQSKYASIFIATQITAQRGKYSYGYKMGTGRLKQQKIMLPVDEREQPDWNYMEQYVKQRINTLKLQYLQSKMI